MNRLPDFLTHVSGAADQGHGFDQPADTIVGGPGDQSIQGTSGDDVIFVNAPAYVDGEGGSDVIHAEADASDTELYLSGYQDIWTTDMGVGVDGGDVIYGGDSIEYMTGFAGGDTLFGAGGDDLLYGATLGSGPQAADGDDHLDGGDGADLLRGNYGDDTLIGGAGDDNLGGQWGNDTLDGGDGRDTASYNYSYESAGVNQSFADFKPGQVQDLDDGLGGRDHLSGIDVLIISGTLYNDTLVGSVADDALYSMGGDDVVSGGKGGDMLLDYDGSSRLDGGAGDDIFKLYDHAYSGNSGLAGGSDTLVGGRGADGVVLQWELAVGAVDLNLTGDGVLTGSDTRGALAVQGTGIESISVTSGAGDDRIVASAGDDLIDGGQGDDRLDGGAGFDRYVVDSTFFDNDDEHGISIDASHLDISGGQSTIIGSTSGWDVVSGFEAVSIVGGLGSDHIVGSDGNDVLVEEQYDASDFVDAGAGNDLVRINVDYVQHTLIGGDGVDTLQLEGGNIHVDLVRGAVWDEERYTSSVQGFEAVVGYDWGNDILGSIISETLTGGLRADTIAGGGGKDVITGLGGADVLSGGAGADTFVFRQAADSTTGAEDRITDLQRLDRIDLHGIDANVGLSGDQAFHVVGHLGGHAGELEVQYLKASGQTALLGDVDGDGQADLAILIDGDHRDFSNFRL